MFSSNDDDTTSRPPSAIQYTPCCRGLTGNPLFSRFSRRHAFVQEAATQSGTPSAWRRGYFCQTAGERRARHGMPGDALVVITTTFQRVYALPPAGVSAPLGVITPRQTARPAVLVFSFQSIATEQTGCPKALGLTTATSRLLAVKKQVSSRC